MTDKVKIYCPIHSGFFYQSPADHLRRGCNICSSSKGELKIHEFLTRNNIVFEKEKRLKGCRNKKGLRFDFFLPGVNMCIEYDGEQHYKHVIFRCRDDIDPCDRFENVKKRDEIKNKYCEKHNIKLLRIPYWDYGNIEEILTSEVLNFKTK
jgi:hypothetical protein